MTSQEASSAINGYNFNINLPSWNSNSSSISAQEAKEIAEQKQRRNNLIAFGILAVIVISIFLLKKRSKKE